jgi:peptidoglycan hydrolase-like protein with peptidoglycan-binding domain
MMAIGSAATAVAVAGAGFTLSQHGGTTARKAHAVVTQQATGPIRLMSISPAAGARQIQGAAPIVVTFSSPVAANTPEPALQPAVAGAWSAIGNNLVFTPAVAYPPSSQETVSVPAGPSGVRGANGGLLTSAVTEHFSTAGYSLLRLAQLLSQLGYLPLTWSQTVNGTAKQEAVGAGSASQSQTGMAFDPPAGTFRWKPGYPSILRSMWSADGSNVIVRGAVMAFQSEHGMTIDGTVTGRLWAAVFRAVSRGEQNTNGYTYAIASKATPETLTIWHNGRQVLRSLTNTGIPVSPTVNGTFPVYLRFRNTIMSGTNPDGSHYSDPVSFVSYFNGGDAVHYFPRGSYGSPQSLGCVELPYPQAEQAYPYLTYGSLVSVTGLASR